MSVCFIIPAHNEADLIGACLRSVVLQTEGRSSSRGPFAIIVVANACTDQTAAVARSFTSHAERQGIDLQVLETKDGGKGNALNLGDAQTQADYLIYLDADVELGRGMLDALVKVLDDDAPRYASGQIEPDPGENQFVRLYGSVWQQLPFVSTDVCGCGLYAVNRAGRGRWHEFPLIHSDDKFVRLHFIPTERHKVDIPYRWPLPKNLWDLIRVRSRWCRGNTELARTYPALLQNEQGQELNRAWIIKLAVAAPIASTVFLAVYIAAALRALVYRDSTIVRWERSR